MRDLRIAQIPSGAKFISRWRSMMAVQQRLSKEEHARRGSELYEKLRSQLKPIHQGKIVAIDVESGEFEIADQTLQAADQIRTRYPEAQIWFVRVGHRAVHRFGFSRHLAVT